MRPTLGDRVFYAVNGFILLVITLVTLFPLYYVFILSFTDPTEYYQNRLILFPRNWSLGAYEYLLSTSAFLKATSINVLLATFGTLMSLATTAGIAYVLSIKRLRGRRFMLLAILLTTLFNPGIIPSYLVVRELGLINSIWSLILPVLSSGWYVLLMKGFFDSIPLELEEAGRIDGASDIGIWARIILPLSLPSLAAFGLFYAVGYWNTYFTAILYINDFKKMPLQVLLSNMLIDSSTGLESSELSMEKRIPGETLKMAAVVISTIPILLVYPFLQKHFAKGVMVGSVKG